MKTIMNLFSASFTMLLLQANTCSPEQTQAEDEEEVVISLDARSFHEQMKAEPGLLIDVRTPGEYAEAYIEGAINIDINSDEFKPAIHRLDMSETYYVYCRSGSRSAAAAGYMEEIGFKRVYNLDRGITSWMDMNLPVIRQVVPVDIKPQALERK